MVRVGILNYGVGNIGSVFRAVEEIGALPIVINDPNEVHKSERLILPGVGNFSECMRILDCEGWTEILRREVLINEKPLLGICLGMQLLANFGEEGSVPGLPSRGLGLLPGKVLNIKTLGCDKRLPHIGWNSIAVCRNSFLLEGIESGTDFYFVHSFAFVADNTNHVIATVHYGQDITAVVNHKNVSGVQFHPEKSSKAGFRIIRNFIES